MGSVDLVTFLELIDALWRDDLLICHRREDAVCFTSILRLIEVKHFPSLVSPGLTSKT